LPHSLMSGPSMLLDVSESYTIPNKMSYKRSLKFLPDRQSEMSDTSNVNTTISYKRNRQSVKPIQKVDYDLQLSDTASSSSIDTTLTNDLPFVPPPEALVETLNKTYTTFGDSPINVSKFKGNSSYREEKKARIESMIEQSIPVSVKKTKTELHDAEVIPHLVQIYNSLADRNKKQQLLSVLPTSWSRSKISSVFGCSFRQADNAKKLKPLEVPKPKTGKSLSDHTKQIVKMYYERDDISRAFPGIRDYVVVRKNNEKTEHQKRMLLENLTEIYRNFKDEFPDTTIGFSSFAALRPPYCVLAGAPGTHTMCVCAMHQNFKLMFLACNLDTITTEFKDYKELIHFVTCKSDSAQEACFCRSCPNCPKIESLREILQKTFSENDMLNIEYKQWISRDGSRCSLETIYKPIELFLDEFLSSLNCLVTHHYISKKQSEYLQKVKSNLNIGEVLVILDYAENYSFVVQDSVQGFYWTNCSVMIATLWVQGIYN
jgi:hypothetical protein